MLHTQSSNVTIISVLTCSQWVYYALVLCSLTPICVLSLRGAVFIPDLPGRALRWPVET